MSAFEDITIVDLDLKKTTWSRVHSSMRTLYLKLSREPDIEWIRYFNTERESRIMPTRHGMWIEDGYIVFDCLLQNVERYHLPDFRQSIDYANERSHERLAERREERAQRRAEISEEHDTLESLRDMVRRDGESEPVAHSESDELTLDAVVEMPEAPATESLPDVVSEAPPVLPVAEPAANDGDDFDSRRDEWRRRFREAMKPRKEPDGSESQ